MEAASSSEERRKPINMGLGTYPAVSLKEARKKAAANAKIGAKGDDPRDARKGIPTFGEAAKKWFDRNSKTWSESRKMTVWGFLKNHALPKLRAQAGQRNQLR